MGSQFESQAGLRVASQAFFLCYFGPSRNLLLPIPFRFLVEGGVVRGLHHYLDVSLLAGSISEMELLASLLSSAPWEGQKFWKMSWPRALGCLGQATGSQWGLHLPCPRWRDSSRHKCRGPVVGSWEEWPAPDLCSWPCLWTFSQAAGPCLSNPVLWSQDQDGHEDQEILSLRAEFKKCIQNLHNHYKNFPGWYFKKPKCIMLDNEKQSKF